LGRARKNRQLLDDLVDVSATRETRAYRRDGAAGTVTALAGPTPGERYAEAVRRWDGLGVGGGGGDGGGGRARRGGPAGGRGGGREARPVVEGVVAALDAWALDRRQAPGAGWRRLAQVAGRLDDSDRRRQLRGLLLEDVPPRAEAVAGLIGPALPWPALWELE